MKIEVEDCDYRYPKILMKTSTRGGRFSIRFQKKGIKSPRCKSEIGYWGHLTVSQSKRLIKELRSFVNVYVNGEDIRFLDGMGSAISSGDEISIVPDVAGGS